MTPLFGGNCLLRNPQVTKSCHNLILSGSCWQASLAKNLLDEGKKATETETKTFVDQIEQAVKETSNQVTIAEKEVEEANKQAQKAQIELDALRVAAKEVEKANKRANQAMQVLGGSTLEDLEEVRMKVTVAMRTTIKSKVKLQVQHKSCLQK